MKGTINNEVKIFCDICNIKDSSLTLAEKVDKNNGTRVYLKKEKSGKT